MIDAPSSGPVTGIVSSRGIRTIYTDISSLNVTRLPPELDSSSMDAWQRLNSQYSLWPFGDDDLSDVQCAVVDILMASPNDMDSRREPLASNRKPVRGNSAVMDELIQAGFFEKVQGSPVIYTPTRDGSGAGIVFSFVNRPPFSEADLNLRPDEEAPTGLDALVRERSDWARSYYLAELDGVAVLYTFEEARDWQLAGMHDNARRYPNAFVVSPQINSDVELEIAASVSEVDSRATRLVEGESESSFESIMLSDVFRSAATADTVAIPFASQPTLDPGHDLLFIVGIDSEPYNFAVPLYYLMSVSDLTGTAVSDMELRVSSSFPWDAVGRRREGTGLAPVFVFDRSTGLLVAGCMEFMSVGGRSPHLDMPGLYQGNDGLAQYYHRIGLLGDSVSVGVQGQLDDDPSTSANLPEDPFNEAKNLSSPIYGPRYDLNDLFRAPEEGTDWDEVLGALCTIYFDRTHLRNGGMKDRLARTDKLNGVNWDRLFDFVITRALNPERIEFSLNQAYVHDYIGTSDAHSKAVQTWLSTDVQVVRRLLGSGLACQGFGPLDPEEHCADASSDSYEAGRTEVQTTLARHIAFGQVEITLELLRWADIAESSLDFDENLLWLIVCQGIKTRNVDSIAWMVGLKAAELTLLFAGEYSSNSFSKAEAKQIRSMAKRLGSQSTLELVACIDSYLEPG